MRATTYRTFTMGVDLGGLELPWLELFIAFQVFVTLFHMWLDVRQLRVGA
jgi:hypothetical protein